MANTRRITAARALDEELSDSEVIVTELLGGPYKLRKKFKRLKFLRLLNIDPIAALNLVFAPGELERLEELDMTEDDLSTVMETVANALVGGAKN